MRRKQELNKEEGEESYHRQLNKEKVHIRRNEREDTFNRKRSNFTPTQHLQRDQNNKQKENQQKEANSTNTQPNSEVHSQQQNKYIVIDERYQDQISKANNQEFTIDSLNQLVTLTTSKQTVDIIYGAIGLRKLTTVNFEAIQQIIDAELVDVLIQLMEYQESPQVQLEATWCIANIAAGTTDQCGTLIIKGIVPRLVEKVNKRDLGIMEQAVWAIGNISSDCAQYRNLLLEAGAGEAITQLILSENMGDHFKTECCWTLANLCRGNPLPEFYKIKNPLRIICTMLAMSCIINQDTFIDSCWALSYHYTIEQGSAKDLLDFNILETLIPIALQTDRLDVVFPILRIVGQMAIGDSMYADHLFQKRSLDLLQKCIQSDRKTMRRESAWVLSNLAASKKLQHVQLILNNDKIIKTILQLFISDSEDVRNEIAFVFRNICFGGKTLSLDHVFVQIEITYCFISLLQSDNKKVVFDALDSLNVILGHAQQKMRQRKSVANLMVEELIRNGGVKIIQELQYDPNDDIYQKAHHILTSYFQVRDPTQDRMNDFKKNVEQIINSATEQVQSQPS